MERSGHHSVGGVRSYEHTTAKERGLKCDDYWSSLEGAQLGRIDQSKENHHR